MQQKQTIKITLNKGTQKQATIQIDERLLDYELEIINRNLITDKNDPFVIPKEINPYVFEVIDKFIELQNYKPQAVIKGKPITSNKLQEQVTDKKYYEFFKEFSDLNNCERATQLLEFADYAKFQILYDAVGAAIAVNYYVGNTQAELKKFMQENRLDKLTPSQISQIMDEHADLFQRIQQKSKEQLLNADK